MLSHFHLIPEHHIQTDLLYQYQASVCWRVIKMVQKCNYSNSDPDQHQSLELDHFRCLVWFSATLTKKFHRDYEKQQTNSGENITSCQVHWSKYQHTSSDDMQSCKSVFANPVMNNCIGDWLPSVRNLCIFHELTNCCISCLSSGINTWCKANRSSSQSGLR